MNPDTILIRNKITATVPAVLILCLLALGCGAGALQSRVNIDSSLSRGRGELIAVISRVRLSPSGEISANAPDPRLLGELKKAAGTAVANSGKFSRVYMERNPPLSRGEKLVFMDIDILSSIKSEFDWSLTWPALYPMTCYWPLQVRKGTIKVTMKASLYDESGKSLGSMSVTVSRKFNIQFYGFFRVGPMEIALVRGYEDALNEFSAQLNRLGKMEKGKNQSARSRTPKRLTLSRIFQSSGGKSR